MTVLQSSYGVEDSPDETYSAPIEPISPEEEAIRCKATEGRMRSRCCGLVECQESRALGIMHVGFLHRTVADFLKAPSVWTEVTALTADTPPDLDKLLRSSCLMEMKRKPPRGSNANDERAIINLRHCLRYCE